MQKLLRLSPAFFLILMLVFPQTAFQGAKNGLLLWSQTLLPILLPFMIFSGVLVSLGLTEPINRILAPFFCRIFPISKQACYPLVLGLFCGMPLGAKTTADLFRCGKINAGDAMFLLGFSNQASMGFLVSYVMARELSVSSKAFLFLSLLYVSALIVSLSFRGLFHAADTSPKKGFYKQHFPFRATEGSAGGVSPQADFFQTLDTVITDSFQTITRIGGYIILFSMLSAFVIRLPFPDPIRLLLSGSLEITGGVHEICNSRLPFIQKTALALGMSAFGGISGIMQTNSVTQGVGLSIQYYVYMKILQGIVCYLLTFALAPYILPL